MTDARTIDTPAPNEPLHHISPKPGGLAEQALAVLRSTTPPRDYELENQRVIEARLRRKEGQGW